MNCVVSHKDDTNLVEAFSHVGKTETIYCVQNNIVTVN